MFLLKFNKKLFVPTAIRVYREMGDVGMVSSLQKIKVRDGDFWPWFINDVFHCFQYFI